MSDNKEVIVKGSLCKQDEFSLYKGNNNLKTEPMTIELQNGSKIEIIGNRGMVSNRGELIRAIQIRKPDHVEVSSISYEDRIEFNVYNVLTNEKSTRTFYIKEDETSDMSMIKKLRIIDLTIDDVN